MGWNKKNIADQAGKRVLITGANSGLGFETAKALYEKGANVVIACRNLDKGNAAIQEMQQSVNSAGSLTVMQLDLASLKSVNAFVINFTKQFKQLDLLINNAGIMALPFSQTTDNFESQFGTNHLGHFALTGSLLPLLENSTDSRVVIVSSLANRLGYINFKNLNSEKFYLRWVAYCQSKLANIIFAKELQKRLLNTGSKIKVISVHPGFSSTNLQRYIPGNKIINRLFSQSQEMGCLPSLYAACAEDIQGGEYVGPGGLFEVRGYPKAARAPKISENREVADRLWRDSMSLTECEYLV